MARPTRVEIDRTALVHNFLKIRESAPDKTIIAMVKANAYGCGLSTIVPTLEGRVDAFGVACIEEGLAIRRLGSRTDCILFQGIFEPDELNLLSQFNLQCVIHQKQQLQWLLATPQPKALKVWVKIDTGMHRLGFHPREVVEVIQTLRRCKWINEDIGLMSHLANADKPQHANNSAQLNLFQHTAEQLSGQLVLSMANSAAILALPETHLDAVRPGIMLYGISPFPEYTGIGLGLKPVMRFTSALSAIHHYPPSSPIGYGSTWQSSDASIIGVVPVGYADGYPRHISCAHVWVNHFFAPVVGRISMDMLTVDLTHCPGVKDGDEVELWGNHMPIETIAQSAGTIAYELLAQMTNRPRTE